MTVSLVDNRHIFLKKEDERWNPGAMYEELEDNRHIFLKKEDEQWNPGAMYEELEVHDAQCSFFCPLNSQDHQYEVLDFIRNVAKCQVPLCLFLLS
ncbi:unnamed protein product [Gongylonema pulchrum]|uniref:SH3 domain-containing protein n=1 Tax=Gongylonema pulchrum TaxID=637853 RepID=A0A183E7J7_9BILA|nr:unnamed protein product [Gongylonema pulchrum]